MRTYRVVQLWPGRWAVEWFVDGKSHGLSTWRYYDEVSATYIAYESAHMEIQEVPTQDAKPIAAHARGPKRMYRAPCTPVAQTRLASVAPL
jgi:hypothetical protein